MTYHRISRDERNPTMSDSLDKPVETNVETLSLKNILYLSFVNIDFIRLMTSIPTAPSNKQVRKCPQAPTCQRVSLEYACSVWDPYLQQDIDAIERVQRRAA